MRLAANDRSRSGWLISRAMAADPSRVASRAMLAHVTHVLGATGNTRPDSACNQYGSRSMPIPTHKPGVPLTELATTVSGPSLLRSSVAMRRVNRSVSNGCQRSATSRGSMRTDS